MSKTSVIDATNKTASTTFNASAYKLSVLGNYALTADEPTEATYSNVTSSIERPELLQYRSRRSEKNNTGLNVPNTSDTAGYVEYGIRLQNVVHTTDNADAKVDIADPCCVNITLKHPATSRITEDIATQLLMRAVSTMFDDAGKSRLGDMMRSALHITAN